MSENRANWLTIRSSTEGGSMKKKNGTDASPSRAGSVFATRSSISLVNAYDRSSARISESARGSSSFVRP
jgi:hypothetical protein